MADAPQHLKQIREDRVLQIDWRDGLSVQIPFRYLRGRCPCDSCVNEFTGERMVDVPDIPVDIVIENAELTGNYALKITWNDRHDSGLYTWEHLRALSEAKEWQPLS